MGVLVPDALYLGLLKTCNGNECRHNYICQSRLAAEYKILQISKMHPPDSEKDSR